MTAGRQSTTLQMAQLKALPPIKPTVRLFDLRAIRRNWTKPVLPPIPPCGKAFTELEAGAKTLPRKRSCNGRCWNGPRPALSGRLKQQQKTPKQNQPTDRKHIKRLYRGRPIAARRFQGERHFKLPPATQNPEAEIESLIKGRKQRQNDYRAKRKENRRDYIVLQEISTRFYAGILLKRT